MTDVYISFHIFIGVCGGLILQWFCLDLSLADILGLFKGDATKHRSCGLQIMYTPFFFHDVTLISLSFLPCHCVKIRLTSFEARTSF